MKDKPKIKVIKREAIAAPEPSTKNERKSKRESAREVVSTVTNWVSDFQARKRDETRMAFETFIVSKPRPSEM